MTDLAARLQKVIEERLAVAHAATQGSWTWERRADEGWGDQGPWLKTSTPTDEGPFVLLAWGHDASGLEVTEGDMAHIELNDPPDAILGLEHALGILERHASRQFGPFGSLCEECSTTEGSAVLTFVEAPCTEVCALATRYGVDPQESQDQSHNVAERGQSPDTAEGT